ncbi:uncharacterized protein LOC117124321 [Anneissia japonica]|uniref:uncharacterized protein LOC117124321 n=1 Tax=Anneissia japonica TaxID=1529436 RepID=UPI001425B863|nr:uncharacterized protein LOC117124321 [Anneissia japonica]
MEPKRVKSSGLRIPVPRPERYEWEEISNSPPPSTQNILQLFDTSTIVRDHPRKYQHLLAQEEVVDENPQPERYIGKQSRSASVQLFSSPSSIKKTSSLVDLKKFFQQDHTQQDNNVKLQEKAPLDPNIMTIKDTFQTDKNNSAGLSAIAQKYDGFPRLSGLQERRFSLDDLSVIKDPVAGSNDDSMSSTSDAVHKTDKVCDSNDLVPVSLQPTPRRLFGIGAYFQPPPETVLLPKDTAKAYKLTDEITKRGITASGIKAGDRRSIDSSDSSCNKKAPTRAEINIWTPSGM